MPIDPESAPTKSSLQALVVVGMAWTGSAQLVIQLFSFINTIILPRFLLPADFGVFGMANIVIGLVGIVNGLGLGAAIIQKPQLTERHLNSVFVANLVLGIGFCILLVLLSPMIAVFYNTPQIQPVLSVLAITFIFSGASATQNVFLAKHMRYKMIAWVTLVSTVFQGITAITLAILQYGVWSLVAGQLMGSFTLCLGLWLITEWKPRFQFDKRAFDELFGFGFNVLGANVTGYLSGNIDNIMVGKYLGSAALGYYDLAYRWAFLPRRNFLGVVHQVMYPAFSTIQDDNAQLRSAYEKLLCYTAIINFPICIGLMLLAPEFISALYIDLWLPAVVPLQILCVSGVIATVGAHMGIILKVKGRPDVEFKMTIISIFLLVILLYIGLGFGLVGVAVAVSLKSLILIGIFSAKTNRLIEMKFSDYLAAFIPATVITFIMALFVLPFQIALDTLSTLGPTPRLIILVSIGVGVYALSMKWLYPRLWDDLQALLTQIILRNRTTSTKGKSYEFSEKIG